MGTIKKKGARSFGGKQ